jgi:hypothetical protein
VLAFKDFVGALTSALASFGAVVVVDTNALWKGQIGQVYSSKFNTFFLLNFSASRVANP